MYVLLRTDGIFDIYIFSVGANLGSSCVRILVDVPMYLGLEAPFQARHIRCSFRLFGGVFRV